MKNWKTLWLSFLFVFLFSGYCFALPNLRPVAPGTGSLQGILGGLVTGGPGIDVTGDQVNYAYFNSTSSSGSIATFIVEIAGNSASNEFGIYDSSDSTNLAAIFSGQEGNPVKKTVTFFSDGHVEVDNITVASGGFDGSFGFYLKNPNVNSGIPFFSEDDLNTNDDPQALIYQGDNATELTIGDYLPGTFVDTEFIIAFEDLVYAGSDKDFDDLVVLVSNLVAVPEPSTMIISSIFLIGAGFYVRKKLHKNS